MYIGNKSSKIHFDGFNFLPYLTGKEIDKEQIQKFGSALFISDAELQAIFHKACRQDNPEKALAALYRWLDRNAGKTYEGSIRIYLKKLEADKVRDHFCLLFYLEQSGV